MALWFLRGVRRGVVTTRYPASPEPSSETLPTPPAFLPSSLSLETAARAAESCPSRALWQDDGDLVFDVGACTACGTCERVAPEAVVRSGVFELAATGRDQLMKRIPIAGSRR